MGTVSLQSADRFLHKGLIEHVKQCICMGMIIFTLRLGGARGPVSVPKNSSVWMRERRMKSLIPYQTNLPDFFYLLFLKVVHDLTNLSVSDGLCATIHTDQPHYTIGL